MEINYHHHNIFSLSRLPTLLRVDRLLCQLGPTWLVNTALFFPGRLAVPSLRVSHNSCMSLQKQKMLSHQVSQSSEHLSSPPLSWTVGHRPEELEKEQALDRSGPWEGGRGGSGPTLRRWWSIQRRENPCLSCVAHRIRSKSGRTRHRAESGSDPQSPSFSAIKMGGSWRGTLAHRDLENSMFRIQVNIKDEAKGRGHARQSQVQGPRLGSSVLVRAGEVPE
jgi:hypothetical protein